MQPSSDLNTSSHNSLDVAYQFDTHADNLEDAMLREQWLALPKLIRLMASHFAEGVILGWICGLLLIRLDIFSIGSLLASADSASLTVLLFVQSGLLFGTFEMSVAIMNAGDE